MKRNIQRKSEFHGRAMNSTLNDHRSLQLLLWMMTVGRSCRRYFNCVRDCMKIDNREQAGGAQILPDVLNCLYWPKRPTITLTPPERWRKSLALAPSRRDDVTVQGW